MAFLETSLGCVQERILIKKQSLPSDIFVPSLNNLNIYFIPIGFVLKFILHRDWRFGFIAHECRGKTKT